MVDFRGEIERKTPGPQILQEVDYDAGAYCLVFALAEGQCLDEIPFLKFNWPGCEIAAALKRIMDQRWWGRLWVV